MFVICKNWSTDILHLIHVEFLKSVKTCSGRKLLNINKEYKKYTSISKCRWLWCYQILHYYMLTNIVDTCYHMYCNELNYFAGVKRYSVLICLLSRCSTFWLTCNVLKHVVRPSIYAVAIPLMFFFDSYFLLQTVDEIYKVASISLSPNVPAQIFVSCSWMFIEYCFLSPPPLSSSFPLSFLPCSTDGAYGQSPQTWRYFLWPIC